MFVTIDPGLQTGWAIWNQATGLVACGLGDPRSSELHRVHGDAGDLIHDVWIESQVIIPRFTKRPADIVKLAQSAGMWAGVYSTLGIEAQWVEPNIWKGGPVPKRISHPRIWSALTPREQSIVDVGCRGISPTKRENVMDAIGIGQWARRSRGGR